MKFVQKQAAKAPTYWRSHRRQNEAAATTCSRQLNQTLAKRETRVITFLRITVCLVLLLTATFLSIGVYHYISNDEKQNFTAHYEDAAQKVIHSFHTLMEHNIEAVAAMSSTITSFAMETNATFPMVTVPDFELLGSHLRVQSGSHIVHYMPVVTDEMRPAWEEYAMQNRHHIDKSFELDRYYRSRQDTEYSISEDQGNDGRWLQRQQQGDEQVELNMTILGDDSGFHPKIWRNQAVASPGDEPEGGGPFIPLWQRSPVNAKKQVPLNQNFQKTRLLQPGLVRALISEKRAFLNPASEPIPAWRNRLQANLKLSQYRGQVDDYVDGLSTFLAYPVFDTFDGDREVVGVLATSVYWKFLFSHLLPSNTRGLVCVVESTSFNQTFSYRIDGQEATFLGMGDHHDPKYDDLEFSQEVNEYLKSRAGPQNHAYATVSLSDKTQYTLRVFPSKETEDPFLSDQPVFFTVLIIAVFSFTGLLFMSFSYVVEKRQYMMMAKVLENAQKAADTERELNEFLSHEVRNPLAAAISACSFVSTAVNEVEPLKDEETRKFVRDDVEVVSASLHYINDFLRSMLDIHQASSRKIKLQMAPADLLHDVLEPISSILHKRMASFDILVDCPENLVVMTDVIRLKQVVLNLVRNASKFVERGFLRMRACVVAQRVYVFVEDSGPGIPLEKQKALFAKYQASLDLLGQGTGIGLSLSKKLMEAMGGDIYLDSTYDSGVEGCPGACFVIQLNTAPLDLSLALLTDSETDDPTCETPVLCHPFPSNVQPIEVDEEMQVGHERLVSDKSTELPGDASFAKDLTSTTSHETPVAEPPPTSAPTPAPAPPAGPTELPIELSVLFVDDDAVLRKLFMRAVKRAMPSWKISEASSGETALRMCEDQLPAQYDLIFLDQYMASVDKQLLGTETAQAMRTKGIKSKICGLSANDLRDAFVNAGADDFVLKPMPCKVEELKKLLMRVLLEA